MKLKAGRAAHRFGADHAGGFRDRFAVGGRYTGQAPTTDLALKSSVQTRKIREAMPR